MTYSPKKSRTKPMPSSNYDPANPDVLAYLRPDRWPTRENSRPKSLGMGNGSRRFLLKHAQKMGSYARPFENRDELKSVDWRAAGRFEQLLVREEHPESPEQIDFLVDLRMSMDWPTSEICEAFSIFHTTKRELVLRLFYHQLYLHLERGDRCCVYF